MSRYLSFALFITVASLVLFGMQFYVARRTFTLFSWSYTPYTTLAVVLLTLFIPFAMFLATATWNRAVQILYVAAMTYLGVLWLAFAMNVAYHPVDFFLPGLRPIARYALPAVLAVAVVYALINAQRLTVREVTITSPRLPADFNVAQISDLHLGAAHGRGMLADIVTRTKALAPDFVVLSGDLFDGSGRVTPETLAPFSELDMPVFMVLGNHDQYADVERILPIIATTNIRLLRNQVVTHEGLLLVGVDNIETGRKKALAKFLASLPAESEAFRLLLFHQPMPLSFLEEHDIDLHLAGHTHGGQIFPFNLMTHLFYSHIRGLGEQNGHYLHVSPGSSTWGPAMRLGSQNEISMLRLRRR
ncbi:MAG: metallophosphoesterase [Candidatus Lernaella stagnicola]|nr:metallophosphoesterase [Candidatus Lernaella stagnicola]